MAITDALSIETGCIRSLLIEKFREPDTLRAWRSCGVLGHMAGQADPVMSLTICILTSNQ